MHVADARRRGEVQGRHDRLDLRAAAIGLAADRGSDIGGDLAASHPGDQSQGG
jgi:hypothetical protein